MTFTDGVILLIVFGILAAIIYYRFVKKKTGLGCNCSLKTTCSLKVDTIKAMFEDIQPSK